MFLSLSILISYFYLSSDHISLPPDSRYYGDLHVIQPVSPQYFQSIQPTSLFMEKHSYLISDSIGRKQPEGLWNIKSIIVYSNVLDLCIYSSPTHWLTQRNFQSCKLHSWSMLYTGVPFFYLLYHIFTIPFLLSDILTKQAYFCLSLSIYYFSWNVSGAFSSFRSQSKCHLLERGQSKVVVPLSSLFVVFILFIVLWTHFMLLPLKYEQHGGRGPCLF